MHADTINAGEWWARPRGETTHSWIDNYKNSLGSRHRTAIVSIVQSLPGTASIVEVGAHCGPNLIRLARDIPTLTELFGFDVNQDAVTAGQAWAQQMGVQDRVSLAQGRMPDATSHMADGCADVVLSCYALAYIAPADLDGVLWEMGRLAKQAIVIAEPMTDAATAGGRRSVGGYQEWAHNYRAASKWIGTWRGCEYGTVRVEPPVDALAQILIVKRPSTPSEALTP